MGKRAIWFVVAALGSVAVTAAFLDTGRAQFVPPGTSPYLTGCAAVDANTVEGFVTNTGNGMIRIDGLVRFTFTVANSMSRPAVLVPTSAMVPPARTMSVAKARLVWSLLPSEVCQFDVTGAVR